MKQSWSEHVAEVFRLFLFIMSAIFSLFNILALLYIFRSVQLGAVIWRRRDNLRQEPLTPEKKRLGDQAAFFIAVPLAVFLHEGAHALAILAAGGQVVEFGYRVFWGYVVPAGAFTPVETWIIAMAGTLGSLGFGLALWLLLRHHPSSSLRYFGLRAFRFQIYFSLIYYPVFTLLGFVGDWRTIYDFAATPVLSAVTAVLHVVLLLFFWQLERRGYFEMPAHRTMEEQQAFEAVMRQAALGPDNEQLQLQYIDGLRRGGAQNRARHALNQFIEQRPYSAEAYLQRAALQSQGRSVSRQAAASAQEALNLGLPRPQQAALAHELVARQAVEADRPADAANHLSEAIQALASPHANAGTTANASALAHLYVLRSHAYRRQKLYERAYQDLQQGLKFGEAAGDETSAARHRQEMAILEQHAGRSFGEVTTREKEMTAAP